ncbi:MAG TPA: hypothetical protein VFH68_27025 [Polyangia bacterium]|jgi:hypothetical protein|nr:hypothetical protein [Polyangia bacterium]
MNAELQDAGARRADGDAPTRAPELDADERMAPGLSSPHPQHPRFTAISWVVLQEVKSDAAMALLRLELLRRQHQEPAIGRAIEFLRCAVGELEALANGESDGE